MMPTVTKLHEPPTAAILVGLSVLETVVAEVQLPQAPNHSAGDEYHLLPSLKVDCCGDKQHLLCFVAVVFSLSLLRRVLATVIKLGCGKEGRGFQNLFTQQL